jgi:hypothetical protein
MLSSMEKDALKNNQNLTPKERAKLHYRVAKKIKNQLSELNEINEALCLIPEKNARRVVDALDDETLSAVFTLAENILRISGYSPIQVDYTGSASVARTGPAEVSKDGKSKTFKVKTEAANSDDMFKQLLVDDHLAVLKLLANPHISELSDSVVYHLQGSPEAVIEAQKRLSDSGRPTLRTGDKRGGYSRHAVEAQNP